jgi:hypothetical protein
MSSSTLPIKKEEVRVTSEVNVAASSEDDPDDSGDDEGDDADAWVELGFIEPIEIMDADRTGGSTTHENPNWSEWDGGKVGGSPCWLVRPPENINAEESITLEYPTSSSSAATTFLCPKCDDTLSFILQIYAPLDEEDEDDGSVRGFHRSLFVFCCTNKLCPFDNQSVRVVRQQLRRKNPFYVHDVESLDANRVHEDILECPPSKVVVIT